MARDNIEIIHQDDNLLVINKPSGTSVTADRSGKADIIQILKRQLPDIAEFRLVHRLDKDTSGVMLLAKNLKTQSTLSSAFERRLIRKTYLALVSGYVDEPQARINVPIRRSMRNPQVMCIDRKRGKPAVTSYERLADFGFVSLLAVYPKTGRTHQIRIHMAQNGTALAIDPLYGSSGAIMLSDFKEGYRHKRDVEEKPLIERLTLHAYRIEIPDSEVHEAASFTAALDKKFAATLKMLAKHNPNGPEAFEDEHILAKILKAEQF